MSQIIYDDHAFHQKPKAVNQATNERMPIHG
jgi:hypothetical protein